MFSLADTDLHFSFQPVNCFYAIGGKDFCLMNKILAVSWANKHANCAVLKPA